MRQLLGILAHETAMAAARWVRDPPTEDRGNLRFWDTLTPLLTGLTRDGADTPGACIWATASLKRGADVAFRPISARIEEVRWHYRHAIEHLGQHDQILHTTTLCLSSLRDGRLLQIRSHLDDAPEPSVPYWRIDASGFTKRLAERDGKFLAVVQNFADGQVRPRTLLEFDRLLGIEFTDPEIWLDKPPSDLENVGRALWESVASNGRRLIARYLAVTSAIDPNWARITMLPTVFPGGYLSFPGGLVICEGRGSRLSGDELVSLQGIASIPYWPWQATVRASSAFQLDRTVRDVLESTSNDYRELEYLFGGNLHTLVDRGGAALERASAASASQVPATPAEAAGTTLEAGEVRSDSELADRTRERRTRLLNIGSHGVHTISVVIPVAPSDDRLRNLGFVLRALDAQTLLGEFPKALEVVVAIDGSDESIAEKVVQMLKSEQLVRLRRSPFVVVRTLRDTRNRSQRLGRSSIRNIGVHVCRGQIVQLLDDSMVLHPEYLLEVLLRYEHLPGKKLALLGFKERVQNNQAVISTSVDRLLKGELIPNASDDFKCGEEARQAFVHARGATAEGDQIDYLDLTGDLCFLTGCTSLGGKGLAHFFTTGLSSVLRNALVEAGGFHPRFDPDWGMEDTYAGALLVAMGNYLVPCHSLLALDLPHEKAKEKTDLKSHKKKQIANQGVYQSLLGKELRLAVGRFSDRMLALRGKYKVWKSSASSPKPGHA